MQIKFDITGMTCAACSARVEKVTSAIDGVEHVEVNLLAGTMSAEVTDDSTCQRIIGAVTKAGYGAVVHGEKKTPEKSDDPQLRQMKIRIFGSAICLVILMYFTMGHMIGLPMPDWYMGKENALVATLLQFFLTLPPVFLNRAYFSRGFKSLYHKAPNMDSLIAVGSGASIVYGVFALFSIGYAMGHGDWNTVELYRKNLYFESAAMILTLITIGKFLEARAKGKTGDAIRKVMDLSPKTACVRRNGNEVTVPIENVKLGEIVVVRSGESIPVDGTVISGRGSVDQSALTGESVPIEKIPEDAVAAATINLEGYLEIRVEKTGEDTTLSQVIHLVEEAGGSKAPIARLADKIAGIFVPTVMGISLVTLVVWLLVGKPFDFALTNAISVLVISCPCALGLATPVAIMVGTGRGANMGILFKNAEALENLHRIDTVVFDKTGTLTVGRPAVTDVISCCVSAKELMQVAASLEKMSEHPFAKAILDKAIGLELLEVSSFQTLPGQGVSGIINNTRYYGGNRRLMEQLNIPVPEYEELVTAGKTPLYFASETGKFLGAIAAADILKADTPMAIQKLHDLDLKVIMLTGDNPYTAEKIAEKAGIDPFQHIVHDGASLADQRCQILGQAADGQSLRELQAGAAGITGTLDPCFGDSLSAQLCATDSAQNGTDSIGVTAEVGGQDNAALETALAQQEQSKCLGNGFLNGSLVAGAEVIMQSHPSLAEVGFSQFHQFQHVLHVVVQPAVGGDAGHGCLDDLLIGAGYHCGGNGGGNGLGSPDTAAGMADFGIALSQFLGVFHITGADDTYGRDAHAGAVGEAVNSAAAGLGGHNATLQVLGSVDLRVAASGEIVLSGNVLQPAFGQVLVRRITVVIDQHLCGKDSELGIVGGPNLATVEGQDHAVILVIFGHTAGITEAVADGQTCHGAQGLVVGQFRIFDQIISCKHCNNFLR